MKKYDDANLRKGKWGLQFINTAIIISSMENHFSRDAGTVRVLENVSVWRVLVIVISALTSFMDLSSNEVANCIGPDCPKTYPLGIVEVFISVP